MPLVDGCFVSFPEPLEGKEVLLEVLFKKVLCTLQKVFIFSYKIRLDKIGVDWRKMIFAFNNICVDKRRWSNFTYLVNETENLISFFFRGTVMYKIYYIYFAYPTSQFCSWLLLCKLSSSCCSLSSSTSSRSS